MQPVQKAKWSRLRTTIAAAINVDAAHARFWAQELQKFADELEPPKKVEKPGVIATLLGKGEKPAKTDTKKPELQKLADELEPEGKPGP